MPRDNELTRRLATIVFADVAGYSQLSEADEAGTHRGLRDALVQVARLVEAHSGTVAHYAGDAVLAEFPSLVDGMGCAVEIQRCMARREGDSTGSARIQFRIGVNVGDVIADEGEIYGDAVNIAVRLKALAEPGGICISEAVRSAIGGTFPVACEYIGEQRLKNLSVPVRAYLAALDTGTAVPAVAVTGGKPAVAVMPLGNLGDADLEHLTDGMTEDIIRELSRFHGFEVIAHASTFRYKHTPMKVQNVAKELGVEFVVEGHVRRAGERLRVNVQLVDARSGHHLWSELYQRDLYDDIDVQDDVVRRIVASIAGRLHAACAEAALRRPREQLSVFEHVLCGQALVGKGAQSNALARGHYRHALLSEPGSPRARAALALSYVDDWWNFWPASRGEQRALAFEQAKMAYGADQSDGKVHWVLGLVHGLQGEFQQATRMVERAIELNPNDADAFAVRSLLSTCQDDLEQARSAIASALMLNPFPSAWYRWIDAASCYLGARLDDAHLLLLEALQQNPELNAARALLVAVKVGLEDRDAARAEAKVLMGRVPGLGVELLLERMPLAAGRLRGRLARDVEIAGIPARPVKQ